MRIKKEPFFKRSLRNLTKTSKELIVFYLKKQIKNYKNLTSTPLCNITHKNLIY